MKQNPDFVSFLFENKIAIRKAAKDVLVRKNDLNYSKKSLPMNHLSVILFSLS
jgi:hypothetical protein